MGSTPGSNLTGIGSLLGDSGSSMSVSSTIIRTATPGRLDFDEESGESVNLSQETLQAVGAYLQEATEHHGEAAHSASSTRSGRRAPAPVASFVNSGNLVSPLAAEAGDEDVAPSAPVQVGPVVATPAQQPSTQNPPVEPPPIAETHGQPIFRSLVRSGRHTSSPAINTAIPEPPSTGDVYSSTPDPTPTPQHEPATDTVPDMTTGEFRAAPVGGGGVIAPQGYPEVSSVITNGPVAAALISSGILQHLSCIRASDVVSSGPFNLSLNGCTVVVSAYDQLLLAVAGRYYGTLPQIRYNERAFLLIHFVAASHRGVRNFSENYRAVESAFAILSSEGLEDVVMILGNAMFTPAVLDRNNHTEVLPPSEGARVLNNISVEYSELIAVFLMVVQLVEGGARCIEPVPVLLESNGNLRTYIDSIATGNGRIRSTMLSLESRPNELPVVERFQPGPVPIQQTPTVPVAAAAPAEPVMTDAFRYGRRRPTRQPTPQAPDQLLRQAPAPQTTVVRDTTAFRTTVADNEQLRAMILTLTSEVQELRSTAAEQSIALRSIAESLSRIEGANAVALAREAYAGLNTTANINRTLMTPQDPATAHRVITATPLAPANTALLSGVISRLEAFSSLEQDPNLLEDLRVALSAIGETGMANNLNTNSVTSVRARNRFLYRLRQMG